MSEKEQEPPSSLPGALCPASVLPAVPDPDSAAWVRWAQPSLIFPVRSPAPPPQPSPMSQVSLHICQVLRNWEDEDEGDSGTMWGGLVWGWGGAWTFSPIIRSQPKDHIFNQLLWNREGGLRCWDTREKGDALLLYSSSTSSVGVRAMAEETAGTGTGRNHSRHLLHWFSSWPLDSVDNPSHPPSTRAAPLLRVSCNEVLCKILRKGLHCWKIRGKILKSKPLLFIYK